MGRVGVEARDGRDSESTDDDELVIFRNDHDSREIVLQARTLNPLFSTPNSSTQEHMGSVSVFGPEPC